MQPQVSGNVHFKKLLDYAHGGDVTDPWYSRDFTRAYRDIAAGCRALLTALTTK